MIKVLDKIFQVLETVISESPTPVTPLWIATKLGMNRPTCSRILKDLTDAGYLMHVSRQAGYTAGPRAYTFAKTAKYKPSFLDKAIPYVKNCARTLAQSALICERRGAERYVLHHSNFSPLNIRINQLSYHDLFDTATGLVLLSAAPKQEQEKIFSEYRAAGRFMFRCSSRRTGTLPPRADLRARQIPHAPVDRGGSGHKERRDDRRARGLRPCGRRHHARPGADGR